MFGQPLSAELRNARALRSTSPIILVDFVLKNNTAHPIELVRRWNSWGAYQWTLEVKDARSTKYLLVNPMKNWSRNFFATFIIAPNSEQVMTCKLLWGELSREDMESNAADEITNSPKIFQCSDENFMLKSGDTKVAARPKSPWIYPVSLVGKFSAPPQKMKTRTETHETNWTGTILTKPVIIKKF
jgi:hypothetical protein